MPIRTETSSLPVSGRFDFNRSLTQHLRRHKATSLLQLEYNLELEVKQGAFEQYWEQHRLPGKPERIIPSPLPRHYRTTSKRRVEVHQGHVSAELDNIELEVLPEQAHLLLLEPESHRQIYTLLLSYLEKPAYREFAKHVNFLIIRGSYDQHSVIFNVDQFDAEVVRKGKLLAEHLQESPIPMVSAFMFLDPSRSDYYFESRRPDAPLHFKKLFGPDLLQIELEGRRFFYEPTGFSQINLSIVPALVQTVRELLPADPGGMLVDLYCGYGLFALSLASDYAGVIALDAAPGAIRAAEGNWHHLMPEANISFNTAAIDGRSLRRFLPETAELKEYVLLDPPRQGTGRGVIEGLAARKPEAVLHIFCGIEQIPREVPEWLHAGYRLDRIVPLDLFPGTSNLECCLLFTPRPPAPPAVSERKVVRRDSWHRREEEPSHARIRPAGDDERPQSDRPRREESRDERPARPFKRREEGSAERPARPYKRREEGGADRPARPYKRREEGSAERPGRPYQRREEGSSERPGRPYQRREEGGTDRPDRPYKRREEGSAERPARPYKRREEGGADRPARPYKRREEGTAERPGRPYQRREEGGTDRPDRPYKRREEGGADRPARPYKRREEGSSERPARPYKRREEGSSERPARPYKRREEGGADRPARPYKRREEGGTDRPDRPYKRREEGGTDRPDRPYKRREGGADRPDRPYQRREEGSSERPARPYKRREEGGTDRPDRPYKRREEGGADRPARPYKRREEGGTERPRRSGSPAPGRPGRGKPDGGRGKSGGFDKGRKGRPMDSKRAPGRKGPSK